MLSLADAETVTEFETVELFEGAVIETEGGVVSEGVEMAEVVTLKILDKLPNTALTFKVPLYGAN